MLNRLLELWCRLLFYVIGLVPAWRASSVDLASAMKDQARGTGQRVRQYLGRTLVVFQVALSLLLLIGAGLLIRSLHNLRQIDLGFRPEQVLVKEPFVVCFVSFRLFRILL